MRLFALVISLILPALACAEPVRIATWNASLSRSGPGLLLNELRKGESEQVRNVIAILEHVRPDILLINEFDYDANGEAAAEFQARLAQIGVPYAHSFISPPNTGRLSGLDLNGDGKTGTPDDAFGWGRFPGQYGMLLLSRFPIESGRTFALLPWQNLPAAELPSNADGTPYPSTEAQAIMRLSSKSHWDIRILVPGLGPLHIFASHPTPPVFDGPEDRNGKRNADEIRFWSQYIDGTAFQDDTGSERSREPAPFVLLGDLNADPIDGDGIHSAISQLLSHPKVQDPMPRSLGAESAAAMGVNTSHRGDPGLDTADWNDVRGPGNLRVDYVLPSSDLSVNDAGVFWPPPDDPLAKLLAAGSRATSDHHLVWVDIAVP